MAEPKLTKSRRKLLKSIALGGGAIAVGKTLPQSWTRPVVESVMLPAHAQASVPSVLSFSGTIFEPNGAIQADNTDANDKSLLAKVFDSVIPEAKANGGYEFSICIEVNGSSCSVRAIAHETG